MAPPIPARTGLGPLDHVISACRCITCTELWPSNTDPTLSLARPSSPSGASSRTKTVLRLPSWKTHRRRSGTDPWWKWLTPLAVFVYIGVGPSFGLPHPKTVITLTIGALLLLTVMRWPTGALALTVVLVPITLYLDGLLYRFGIPGGTVNQLSHYKELIALGLLLIGAIRLRSSGRRLDALDWCCLAYLAIATAYLLIPGLFGVSGGGLSFNDRLVGWRNDAIGVLLLLGARHVMANRDQVERVVRTLVYTSAVVAGCGVLEFFSSSTWNDLAVNTFWVTRFQTYVLKTPVNLSDVRVFGHIGGKEIVRVGSVLDYTSLGCYLVIFIAIAVHQLIAGRAPRWYWIVIGMAALAAVFSQTRTGLIALGVVGALSVRSLRRQPESRRVKYWLLLATGLLLALPVMAGTGVAGRFLGQDQASNTSHQAAFTDAVSAIADQPLGYGLATSAGAGQRFAKTVLISENQYLQYGLELGVVPMALFVAIILLLLRRLRMASDAEPDDVLGPAIRVACIGVFIGTWFLQILNTPAVSYTLFGLAGLILGGLEARHPELTPHKQADQPLLPLTTVIRSGRVPMASRAS